METVKQYDDDAPVIEQDEYVLPDYDANEIVGQLEQRGGFDFHCELKAEGDSDKRVISGYANTKHIDRMSDIVEPSAFKSSLSHFLKHGVILAHHDPSNVVGVPLDAKIDSKGLKLKAQGLFGNDAADPIERVWNVVKQGGLRAFSVGFRILPGGVVWEGNDNEKEDAPRVRRITKLELYEVSIVSIPANRQSVFSVAKSLIDGTDLPKDNYDERITATSELVKVAGELPEEVAEEYTALNEYVKTVADRCDDFDVRTKIANALERVNRFTS